MKEPVLANPLDQSEKKSIFENIDITMSEAQVLDKYVDAFLQKNGLTSYETGTITRRKLIASFVLALAVGLEIVYIALYHNLYFFAVIVAEFVFYFIFFRRQILKKYLIREVVRRPDDNLDNILISQVSGAKNGRSTRILCLLPILIVFVTCCLLFLRPHMIFERESIRGYTLRYYTMSIFPEEKVVIPETYKGEPVDAIRGNVFRNMKSIRYVSLPSQITEIRGSTFEYCKNLQEIDIPEGVTRIGGHAFCDCRNLRRVSLPSTITYIGSSAFRRCKYLYSVDIPREAFVNERAFKESPTSINYY